MSTFTIEKVTVAPKEFVARVALANDVPATTDELPEVAEALLQVLPHLAQHACVGDTDPKFGEVIDHTELAHVLEHVTVELLAQTNRAGAITTGRTQQLDDTTWTLSFPCPDDVLVAAALSSAIWLLDWAMAGAPEPAPDIAGTVAGLGALIDSLADTSSGTDDNQESAEDVTDDITAEEDLEGTMQLETPVSSVQLGLVADEPATNAPEVAQDEASLEGSAEEMGHEPDPLDDTVAPHGGAQVLQWGSVPPSRPVR